MVRRLHSFVSWASAAAGGAPAAAGVTPCRAAAALAVALGRQLQLVDRRLLDLEASTGGPALTLLQVRGAPGRTRAWSRARVTSQLLLFK